MIIPEKEPIELHRENLIVIRRKNATTREFVLANDIHCKRICSILTKESLMGYRDLTIYALPDAWRLDDYAQILRRAAHCNIKVVKVRMESAYSKRKERNGLVS